MDIRSSDLKSVNKDCLSQPPCCFFCNHAFCHDIPVQIGKPFVILSFHHLKDHKALDLLLVVLINLRIGLFVFMYISIQKRIVQIVKTAVKGKIHQYDLWQYRPVRKLYRHHIILIQSGDSKLLLNPLCIPFKGFLIHFTALDQKCADCTQWFI